jgi:hypothetical protein
MDGQARFGDVVLKHGAAPPQWSSERVPVDNDYFAHAGVVVARSFGQTGTRALVGPLLAPDFPYYPELEDAARDWLPFPVYHGSSDARNEQVLFLLPETRAFVAGAGFSEDGRLDITVEGTEAEKLSLLIKGAYWRGRTLCHANAPVQGSKATLDVPWDADRLEFFLLDSEGVVYDFHREDHWSRQRGNRSALGRVDRAPQDQVRKAVQEGEGSRIEFKPFIDVEKIAPGDRKAKFHEVVRTVVAFANTDGGRIYLGVEDDCVVSGIDARLAEWAKGPVDDSVLRRYLDILKSKIKGLLHRDVGLHVSSVEIDDVVVAVIEVTPSESKPISMSQDCYLYVRSGASNRKVPPEQWRNVLDPTKPGRMY